MRVQIFPPHGWTEEKNTLVPGACSLMGISRQGNQSRRSPEVHEGTSEQASMTQETLCIFVEEGKPVMGDDASRTLKDISFKPCQAWILAYSNPVNSVLFNLWKYSLAFLVDRKFIGMSPKEFFFSRILATAESLQSVFFLICLAITLLPKNVSDRALPSAIVNRCIFACSTEFPCIKQWLLPGS